MQEWLCSCLPPANLVAPLGGRPALSRDQCKAFAFERERSVDSSLPWDGDGLSTALVRRGAPPLAVASALSRRNTPGCQQRAAFIYVGHEAFDAGLDHRAAGWQVGQRLHYAPRRATSAARRGRRV